MTEQHEAPKQNALVGQPAEIGMIIHITRKATGLTETYHLTGNALPYDSEQSQEPPKGE